MLLSDKEQLNFGNMREIRDFFFFLSCYIQYLEKAKKGVQALQQAMPVIY